MAQKKTIYDLNGQDVEATFELANKPVGSNTNKLSNRTPKTTSGNFGVADVTGAKVGRNSNIHNNGGINTGANPTPIDTICNPLIFDTSSPYYACGSMSEEVMHRYLDRVLQMSQISKPGNPVSVSAKNDNIDTSAQGTIYSNLYSPDWWDLDLQQVPTYFPPNDTSLYDETTEHGQLLRFIINSGAKFVWDMAYFWDGNLISNKSDPSTWKDKKKWVNGKQILEMLGGQLQDKTFSIGWTLCTLKADIDYIHEYDPEIICGASLSEVVSNIQGIQIPDYVWLLFTGTLPASPQYFKSIEMLSLAGELGYYVAGNGSSDHANITKVQSIMWNYFLATKYIDAGCEHLHIGDAFTINRDDHHYFGNNYLWLLVKEIRNYAKTYARRGFVLIDSHTGVTANTPDAQFGFYYDPNPSKPLPDFERQLIFDFHSAAIELKRFSNNSAYTCHDGITQEFSSSAPVFDYKTKFGTADQRVKLPYGYYLLDNSWGGLNPQGWYCSHNPVFLTLDNGDNSDNCGCNFNVDDGTYGFEDTSWFANQSGEKRNLILEYLYYKIKCLDVYSHFVMPGRIPIHTENKINGLSSMYSAFETKIPIPDPPYQSKSLGIIDNNQYLRIEAIWNNAFKCPLDWGVHNFTIENVAANFYNINPDTCLVRIGDDKLFYIGTDKHIHGYVRINNGYNGGTWWGVSPTYASYYYYSFLGMPANAHSDLVASPDGTRLLYIGEDGYIYGFYIQDLWHYEYITEFKVMMQLANIKADFFLYGTKPLNSNLIFPTNNTIFFIGTKHGAGTSAEDQHRIHNFHFTGTDWNLVSPTYLARFFYGQSLSDQMQASGGLTYHYNELNNTNFIYYVGTDGLLYYYMEEMSINGYYYAIDPGSGELEYYGIFIVGNLAIYSDINKTRIYFIGCNFANDTYRPFVIDNNYLGYVDLYDLSQQALAGGTPLAAQLESDPNGFIAVSPDGSTIVYFSRIYQFIGWYYFDGTHYTAHSINQQIEKMDAYINQGSSLQFKSNDDFFYISKNNVYHCRIEESYCNSPAINEYSE